MPLIESLKRGDGETHGAWMFFCPGCRCYHSMDERWTFDGNMEAPTLRPSLVVDRDRPEKRCHLFVTAGRIQFLGDSHHELRGTTVAMVDTDTGR